MITHFIVRALFSTLWRWATPYSANKSQQNTSIFAMDSQSVSEGGSGGGNGANVFVVSLNRRKGEIWAINESE